MIVAAATGRGALASFDWAATGAALLGVRAALAQSYERIHRSNLVGVGVLPLEFKPGESASSLGLTGHEAFDIEGLGDEIRSRQELTVTARAAGGTTKSFRVLARLDSPVEVKYYRNGGILQTVLRSLLDSRQSR